MNKNSRKLTFLALMIAFNFVFTSIFRIEGMAPISSFMNILAGIIMGPLYAFYMALTTGILRIFILGAPPFAITGAVFGAILAGLLFRINHKNYMAMIGEFIGTGIIGALASYPLLLIYTGSSTSSNLFWLMFIPKFCGAAIMGIILAAIVLKKLQTTSIFKTVTSYFK